MILLELNDDIRSLVCPLDPFSLLDRSEYSKDVAYGILFEDEKGAAKIGGLMLVREPQGEPVIDWLYVVPEYRRGGFADFAIDSLFTRAAENGTGCVRVALKNFYGKELVCIDCESFFERYGFTEDKSYKGRRGETYLKADTEQYIRIKENRLLFMENHDEEDSSILDELYEDDMTPDMHQADNDKVGNNLDQKLFIKSKVRKKEDSELKKYTLHTIEKTFSKDLAPLAHKPIPIRELSLAELESGIEEALAHKAPCLVDDLLSVEVETFDTELSFVIREEEDIAGILLVNINLMETEFDVYLVHATGKNKSNMIKHLLLSFVREAVKDGYPATTKVVFRA